MRLACAERLRDSGRRALLWAALAVPLAGGVLSVGCEHDPMSDRCADGFTPYSAPTLIGDLYATCFPRCAACANAQVNAVLYLDTRNLPTANAHVPKLVLSSQPVGPAGAGLDRLEYFFDPDTLPAAIDPGLRNQAGWKVRVTGATLEYCESCLTDCGLAPILLLRGGLGAVAFFHDPADTMHIFIAPRPRMRS